MNIGQHTRRVKGAIAALAAAATVLGASTLVTAPAAQAATVDTAVQQAVSYAAYHGVQSSVAVLDESTGKLYAAGNYASGYGSASVVKLFIATELLATGRMSGTVEQIAWKMITQSDDASAERLFPLVGYTDVINWVKNYYGIPALGSPSPKGMGCWGNTQITALGMVQFYQHMQRDSRVAPWLVNAIHHYAAYGSDGTNQTFGIPSATSGAGVKQGWGNCSANDGHAEINTTGIVDGNRYAVAILAQSTNGAINSNSFDGWLAGVVTTMARTVLPGGAPQLPQTPPRFHVDAISSTGNLVTAAGWAYYPVNPSAAMLVGVNVDGRWVWSSTTTGNRTDVNRYFGITGLHGYRATFPVATGTHNVCVWMVDTGRTTSAHVCRQIVVAGPARHVDAITAGHGRIEVRGWALDLNNPAAQTDVGFWLDGRLAWFGATSVARPDVDAYFGATGNHGFDATVAAAAGTHTVCAVFYSANRAFHSGACYRVPVTG